MATYNKELYCLADYSDKTLMAHIQNQALSGEKKHWWG